MLVARDDDVVENREAQDLPGPHDVGGRRDVFGARSGIATYAELRIAEIMPT
jgi:hypothetical protein